MTPTPEKRALQIAMRCYPGVVINGEGVVALGEAIASAIREAEDAAYETAAAHIVAKASDRPGLPSLSVGDELLLHGAHWSAQRVLELKSPKEV
jgi:hypothetical protein